ncbi:MAG: bifunctional DedA family/phosphatase PAP2 family protein [Rubrobacteraceae bacterium]
MHAIDGILSLLAQYGYLIVFFGVMAESAGAPLPGETILIAAGVLAQRSGLDLGDAILFGILGAVIGDQIGYWAGRKGGRPFVLRWGRYVLITPERLRGAENFFARHGGKAVFMARFVAGLRVFGALVAGISHMRWRTFLLYNALGGAIWATAAVLVGYLLGGSLGLVEQWLGRATFLLGAVLVFILIFYLAYRWVVGHRNLLADRWRNFLSRPLVSRTRERYSRQLGWLFRRMSPGQYLGLHFTLGLLAAAGGLWLFGGLAEDYVTRGPIVRFDQTLANALHAAATPFATKVFLAITALGSIEAIVAIGLTITGILFWRRLWLHASVWLVALVGVVALNALLKQIFERPRPVFADPILVKTSYSFPSGHAMDSLVMYGMLAYFALLVIKHWRVRVAILFGAALLVILIGFSRLYLGVHYFSDVVAGFAAGGVWLSACVTGLETLRRRPTKGLR